MRRLHNGAAEALREEKEEDEGLSEEGKETVGSARARGRQRGKAGQPGKGRTGDNWGAAAQLWVPRVVLCYWKAPKALYLGVTERSLLSWPALTGSFTAR